MAQYEYDLFVIGAGSGGVRAARMSSQYGAKVAIAEEYRVGGTCVIRGCVPKKLLVYASRFQEQMEDSRGYGWTFGEGKFNWETLIANKDREIDRLSGIYNRNLEKSGVETFSSRAVLQDAHTVHLTKFDQTVTAKNILIATGSTPFIPKFTGSEHAITSNEAFHLKELPGRIVIVGGGYIAVEFATIFSGLGSHVTIVYRGPQILRGFDDDMRDGVASELVKRGIDIRCNSDVATIREDGSGYCVDYKDGGSVHADKVMYATGRVPSTVGLGLHDVGVELGWNGYVIVDEYSRTCIENIYAIGDVTHRVNLTPVAIDEAMAFASTVFKNMPVPVDHSFIPTAVFCHPEVGTIGLSEEQAREKYREIDIFKSLFKPMLHTLSGRDEKMIMKLVVDGESGKVLGCHIMGPDAAEMVQLIAISMRMGATKADFDATMALHPCAAEELVTMREKWHSPRTLKNSRD